MCVSIIWGMSTLIELDDIEANVNLCSSLRLRFIELNMNLPEYQPGKIDIDKLIYLKEKNNIFYTIHLPEEFDIANFNGDIVSAYYKIFKETAWIAAKLNSPVINMHMNMGVYFTLPEQKIFLYSRYFDDYIAKIKSFGAYTYELYNETGVKLCIENTGIYDKEYIKKAVDILLEHDNIFLTWDIGHDHSSSNKDRQYILNNISKLRHMHFHDAIGTKDHLPLFTGDIDLDEKLDIARNNTCTCVIETKTVKGLQESVDSLINKALLV